MKNKFFILLFAGLFIYACNDDSSLYAPLTDDEVVTVDQRPELQLLNPHLKGTPVTRPMKVKTSGYFQYNPPPECNFEIIGKGTATHMGKFELYLSYCHESPPGGYQMAANGDMLFTNRKYDEDGEPVVGEDENGFYEVYEYTGGTGRFEGAYGEIRLYNDVTYGENGPVAFSNFGIGKITY